MTNLFYPKTILEFQQIFSTEEACEAYLYNSRWPDGFRCPICNGKEYYYIATRKLFQCRDCWHQTSLTAGTVMHNTKQPLRYWFWSAYLMTTKRQSISAIELQRQLGIKRYEVAFQLLHKLRSAMVNPERTKIGSVVEVDDTYVGGATTGGKRGRGTQKAIVIVAVERLKNGHAGRIRLRQIPDMSQGNVVKFLKDNVEHRSTVITDSFKSYRAIGNYGYKHKMVLGSGTSKTLPLAHLAISNLKSWLKGTFHGVSKKHLQAYLNEYVFHFNRRFYPMAGFRTILGLSSKVDFPTYRGLYSGEWQHPNPRIGWIRIGK
jgi:transposase-like protein